MISNINIKKEVAVFEGLLLVAADLYLRPAAYIYLDEYLRPIPPCLIIWSIVNKPILLPIPTNTLFQNRVPSSMITNDDVVQKQLIIKMGSEISVAYRLRLAFITTMTLCMTDLL